MSSKGFVPTKQPLDRYTQMPELVTQLPPKKLQHTYTAMVAWQSYANEELAKIEIDILEAEDDLISAKNALTAALVDYRIRELELQRDMGVLDIGADGMWSEFTPPEPRTENDPAESDEGDGR